MTKKIWGVPESETVLDQELDVLFEEQRLAGNEAQEVLDEANRLFQLSQMWARAARDKGDNSFVNYAYLGNATMKRYWKIRDKADELWMKWNIATIEKGLKNISCDKQSSCYVPLKKPPL